MMVKLDVGQSLWINGSSFYKQDPRVDEYIIEKINSKSVYVKKKNGDFQLRLDKKTLTCSELPFFYKAYLSASQYWLTIERAKLKEELLVKINSKLKALSLEQLQEIDKYVDEKKVMKV
ncbi:Uncharacterized protein PIL02S_03322 [Paenibacillus illinoisensis]|uniref:Uncharacterized protein n=2 Tax=Paenibacillus illinoisensis TaxID=59845 RepID=A0A2W0C6Z2_9BACL|nr:Uncharacterized protein PIL02S_03322 [Paenibacillus illinoisensis]